MIVTEKPYEAAWLLLRGHKLLEWPSYVSPEGRQIFQFNFESAAEKDLIDFKNGTSPMEMTDWVELINRYNRCRTTILKIIKE